MATCVQTVDLERLITADAREALTCEVRRGLIDRPRSLSPWMFYDAEGSRLFERITTLPEYYPTRTERAILAGHADAIVAAAHGDSSLPLRLIELGAGTASKTCVLLEAALRHSDDVTYVPVDVCSDALELACHNVACALPEVRVEPIVRNYVTHPLELDPFNGTSISAALADRPIAGENGSISMMTKGGLNAATQNLAVEYGKNGIRFNAVAPGEVDTPMHPSIPNGSIQQIVKRAMVKDIVDAVLYLYRPVM